MIADCLAERKQDFLSRDRLSATCGAAIPMLGLQEIETASNTFTDCVLGCFGLRTALKICPALLRIALFPQAGCGVRNPS